MLVENDVIVLSSDDEGEESPEWLRPLLRTKFWGKCEEHSDKTEWARSMFCLRCYEVFCPRCVHNEPGHRLLKVWRYTYRSLVFVHHMQNLNVDVSTVQTFYVNRHMGVHLRPVKRSKYRRAQSVPRCLTCGCWLCSTSFIFCSLACKERINVPLDEFSASEAHQRVRAKQAESFPMGSSSSNGPAAPQLPLDESAMRILAEACRVLSMQEIEEQEIEAPPAAMDEQRGAPEAEAEPSNKRVKKADVPKSPPRHCALNQVDDVPASPPTPAPAPPPAPVLLDLNLPAEDDIPRPMGRNRPRKQES